MAVPVEVIDPLANGSVVPRFAEEELQMIVEWFDENAKPLLVINPEEDPEPTPVVTIDQLELYLAERKIHRRSFYYPTYVEIMKEVELLNMGRLRMLTKNQFIYILDRWYRTPDVKHELKLAFRMFDPEERGFIEIDVLRQIVTLFGEPYANEEVIELLRDANVRGNGNVYYDHFVDTMFILAPELYKTLEPYYLYEDPDEDPSVPPPTPVLVYQPAPLNVLAAPIAKAGR